MARQKKPRPFLSNGFHDAAARDAIEQLSAALARLSGLIERVRPNEAAAVAAALLLPAERLTGLADYLQHLTTREPELSQPPGPAEGPAAAGVPAAGS